MTTRIVWAMVAAVVVLAASTVWRAERVLGPSDTEFRYAVVVPPGASLAAIERTWRARLDDAAVRVERNPTGGVEVVVQGAPRAYAAALARALDRPGAIELRWVVSDTGTARAWYRAFATDEDPGIRAHADEWRVDGGGDRLDFFLVGADRETIVSALLRRAPGAPVPPDLELVVEALPASGEVRTYLVAREPIVRATDLVAATVTENPVTGRAQVMVSLSRDAGARFAEETERHRGEKCAMIVDGISVAAPIVQGSIRGGRFSLLATDRPDAEALAAALRGGVLPAGIQARLLSATGHDRSVWGVRLAIAAGALVVAFVVAPWVRRRLPLPPELRGAAARPRWRWWPPIAALLVTSAVLGVLWYARWTLLFGFSDEVSDALVGDRTNTAIASTHLLALGLAPYLTAVLAVELFAIAWPRWRTRRLGTAMERRSLNHAAAVVTVVLAIVQAMLLVRFFGSLVGEAGEEVIDAGLLPRVAMVLSLLAGVALTLGGAALITRYGLGNGVLVIAAATALERLISVWPWRSATSRIDALAVFALVAVGAGLLARLRPHGRRLPWTGLAPALVTAAVLAALVAFVDSSSRMEDLWRLARRATGWPTAVIAVAVTASMLWPHRGASHRVGGVLTVAAVLGLVAVLVAGPPLAWPLSFAPAVLVGVAVLELGVGASRRGRLSQPMAVLVVHDVERADQASDRLAVVGISHAVTGVHARALLRFLAAYCPITISVAAADVPAARSILDRESTPSGQRP